jgi:hypothetical protein
MMSGRASLVSRVSVEGLVTADVILARRHRAWSISLTPRLVLAAVAIAALMLAAMAGPILNRKDPMLFSSPNASCTFLDKGKDLAARPNGIRRLAGAVQLYPQCPTPGCCSSGV